MQKSQALPEEIEKFKNGKEYHAPVLTEWGTLQNLTNGNDQLADNDVLTGGSVTSGIDVY